LLRDGEKTKAIYKNTPETDLFLDKNKETYIGGILEMSNDRLYNSWGNLEDALRSGKPQSEVKDTGENVFEKLYEDDQRLRQFIAAMASAQKRNFELLADQLDFSSCHTFCDIGGADGSLCIAVASRWKHLQCKLFDLPQVISLARENIGRQGLQDRIELIAGDFWEDDFPEADIITMGNILHDWDADEKNLLLKKAYASLQTGGRCMIIENIIDDERRENVSGLLMSLNMLVETPGGFNFTGEDFKKMSAQAGFSSSEIIPITENRDVAVAFK